MAKSKDAFRTISEVADWLETPAHVLRFWESKFTQVKPVKRAGGRRYYRPADMKLLGGIKKLLHDDGLTIKGAQKLLREHGVKHVCALSQPLDEDLIEDAGIEEARYEEAVQLDPIEDAPATVVSFPSKEETPPPADAVVEPPVETTAEASQITPASEHSAPEVAQTEPPETIAQSDATESSDAATLDAPETEPAPAEPEDAAEAAPEVEDPAEGSFTEDALPAFLRRSSPAPEPIAPVASADAPAKVTIDPVATLVPVANSPEAENSPEASREQEQPEDPVAMFAHRAASDAPVVAEDETAAPPVALEPAAFKAPMDVPPLSLVAPEIDSFTPPGGILAAVPQAKRLSPQIAAEMSEQLSALRALRDRMVG